MQFSTCPASRRKPVRLFKNPGPSQSVGRMIRQRLPKVVENYPVTRFRWYRLQERFAQGSVRLGGLAFILGAMTLLPRPAVAEEAAPLADAIFLGGDIVTMDEQTPRAEALAVRNGNIVAVGAKDDMMELRGETTEVIDLEGKALLPGFIDAHGHLSFMAQQVALCNVASPPVGPVENLEDLGRELLAYRDRNNIAPGEWIVGTGYDDSLLAEQRHPNRADLDLITDEHPIFLLHVSAHLATCNSLAIEKLGITAERPNPPGGVIQRIEGGNEPNGVLEESAMMMALSSLPQQTLDQRLDQIEKAQQIYASYGITTIQDGFTRPDDLKLLRQAAEEGRLILDVIAYPGWLAAYAMMKDATLGTYESRLKIGGVKIVLDGSPQGKTAFLREPYHVPPAGKDESYRGYPTMAADQVAKLIDRYFQNGWQVLAHCNGDAAAEQLVEAVAQALESQEIGDRRTVMIHAQMVRDDQLDRMKTLEIMPSFFSAHAYFWGDWHRDSVMGPQRASRLSPARSTIDRGIPFTIHNDAPVVPPDVMMLLWAAVNRTTRSGKVIGPDQRITIGEALRAVTTNAAYQNFEEDTKGSLEVGKFADLVVLSENPLNVEPERLKDVAVVETFSRGQSVYRRP